MSGPSADPGHASIASSGASAAVVAVPGLAGLLEAHKALGAGMDVLLMEDGFDVAHEAALKGRARRRGLLALGPGAGTGSSAGLALGFSVTAAPGPVAVVGASGSAVREVAALLDRAGTGVRACNAVGPRDLTPEVGGRGLASVLDRLSADRAAEVVVAVLWPADPGIAAEALAALGRLGRPAVACGLGTLAAGETGDGVLVTTTLEDVALSAAALAGGRPVPPGPPRPRWVAGGHVRGLYCGAGLCAEAVAVLEARLGDVASNVPGAALPLARSRPPRGHACIDLGDPAVRGASPHPMLDPAVRSAALAEAAGEQAVRVILLDLPIGRAVHPDPAGALAPAVTDLIRRRPQVDVVAHVVGTEADPQGLAAQERRLADLGVRVAPSNAAAARLAAAVLAA